MDKLRGNILKKRILISAILVSVLLILGCFSNKIISELADIKNSISNITKQTETSFDATSGTLTITGKGDIKDLYPFWRNEKGEADHDEIKKLVLSEGITGVYNSFNHLVALKEIQLPSTLKVIDESFNEARGLEALKVPKTVERIVNDSFLYCYNLKDLQFEGAITIGEPRAFHYCAIEKIEIPSESFLSGAFANCYELKEIVIGPRAIVTWSDLGEGDVCDSFNSELSEQPRVYVCSPIHAEWDPSELRCGKNAAYKPIIVPEGENWENYRYMPLELREDGKKRLEYQNQRTDEEIKENDRDFFHQY